MAVDRPVRRRLKKVEAVITDRSATLGEKEAARAAASRIRQKSNGRHSDDSDRPESHAGIMYRLGRAWGGVRAVGRGETHEARGVMYSLGRAWRGLTSRR